MAYFEFHDTLPDHPKVQKMMDLLHIGNVQAVGHVARLFSWAIRYRPSGVLPTSCISLASGWHGPCLAVGSRWRTPGLTMASVLLQAGFLEATEDPEELEIHDWRCYTKGYRKAVADRDRYFSREIIAKKAVSGTEQNRTEQRGGDSSSLRAEFGLVLKPPSLGNVMSLASAHGATSAQVTGYLFRLALQIAHTPGREDTIRREIEAMSRRIDVGVQKLEAYLMSQEACGLDIVAWRRHFEPPRQAQDTHAEAMKILEARRRAKEAKP